MKKIFIFLLVFCFSINSHAQVYLKGSAAAMLLGEGSYTSLSYAGELKYKSFGIEYMQNNERFSGDASYESKTHQCMLKGYLNFIKNTRLQNLYIGGFYRYKNRIEYEDTFLPGYPNPQTIIGNGLGLMVGKNYDFYKYFGMEVGIYYYNLNFPSNWDPKIGTWANRTDEPHFGLRLYLYIKTAAVTNKKE